MQKKEKARNLLAQEIQIISSPIFVKLNNHSFFLRPKSKKNAPVPARKKAETIKARKKVWEKTTQFASPKKIENSITATTNLDHEIPLFSDPQEHILLPHGYRKPSYPRKAQQKNQEGTVKIKFTVLKGLLKEVKIARSSGFELLDASALIASRNWLFRQEISLVFYQEFSFVLR